MLKVGSREHLKPLGRVFAPPGQGGFLIYIAKAKAPLSFPGFFSTDMYYVLCFLLAAITQLYLGALNGRVDTARVSLMRAQ